MKKKRVIFYCITLMLFCQDLLRKSCPLGVASKIITIVIILLGSLSGQYLPVSAISVEQRVAVSENCEVIRDSLKNVQKLDSKTRVFFGSHYETILAKFITPLNVRMVENNLSRTDLIENQNNYTTAKSTFAIDFVIYQQALEELIGIDCRAEPEKFYEKLVSVREKREMMVYDIQSLKGLALKNIDLAQKLRGEL